MKKIGTLTIIGVGLIGGSIARKVKEKNLADKVVGFGRKKSSLDKALKSKAIDEATLSFGKAVENADAVIIATPVGLIPFFLKKCRQHCKAGCIVTDVGSTKEEITDYADKIFGRDIFFVGGHPMAGSEKKSFECSKADLFDNSICFLTKTKKTSKDALEKIEFFWRQLGAKIVIISPKEHDRITAQISHLPHIAAVSLVNSASDSSIKFAGNGFKDTTRIASSDADIWLDIFFSNQDSILKSMDEFIENLRQIKDEIKNKKRTKLRGLLERARLIRSKMVLNPTPSNGVLDPTGRIIPPSCPSSKLRGFRRRGGIK